MSINCLHNFDILKAMQQEIFKGKTKDLTKVWDRKCKKCRKIHQIIKLFNLILKNKNKMWYLRNHERKYNFFYVL